MKQWAMQSYLTWIIKEKPSEGQSTKLKSPAMEYMDRAARSSSSSSTGMELHSLSVKCSDTGTRYRYQPPPSQNLLFYLPRKSVQQLRREMSLWALLVVIPACSIAFFRKSWDHIIFLVISQLHYCARTTPFTSIVEFIIWIAHFTAFETSVPC